MKLCGFKSKHSFVKILVLILSMVSSSCVENGGLRSRSVAGVANGNLSGANGTGSGGTVNNAAGETTTPGMGTANGGMSQMVELSHFVDPYDGSYKKKLTIPKNFKGNLYLSGLNVASLASQLIKVRFNLGRERQSVTVGATLARAPGIVPNTSIQVLVLDMNSNPFGNIRLGYDLYDYNDYDANPTMDVVTDARDGGLYCRGLMLSDDPTFLQGNGTTCDGTIQTGAAAPAVCKYAYAKITDAALQYPVTVGAVTTLYDKIPTLPQVWGAADLPPASSNTFMSNMCLPDYDQSSFTDIVPLQPLTMLPYGLPLGLKYNLPYRHINSAEWQISGAALYSTSGLYANGTLNASGLFIGAMTGYQSLLFPRAGKLQLNPNVNYYGSIEKFVTGLLNKRVPMVSDASGTTQYVDGCNLRAMNYDSSTNEGMGSCNVSASIEVFYLNSTGQEILITKDNALKLQLIRPSTKNTLGQEVLSSAFKSCSSSTTCGSGECCYNNRCWSKELVTQCVDQLPVIGNQPIGANCATDYECTSLCCNPTSGSCAPHNPNGTSPVFCSKAPGQQCVTKDFCRKDYVSTCVVTKTGLYKSDGVTPICTLRCNPVETYGICQGTTSGATCLPPAVPAVPSAADVDACTGAI